ncbi:hypothetical protein DFH07DRAFT_949723 [Mycena maculata]|uniref:Uncharacterized protein n=1 Tax=Mycena maculata TaxID=230809 RepID=A0AAD7KB26_9AGAR|nr:hypothetical protein DFH07DRAFT_949723 [Mycena maculata]
MREVTSTLTHNSFPTFNLHSVTIASSTPTTGLSLRSTAASSVPAPETPLLDPLLRPLFAPETIALFNRIQNDNGSVYVPNSHGYAPALQGNATYLQGSRQPSVRSDLLLTVRDRDEFWQIDPLIADRFWLTGRLLGNLVVSAAHGINFVDHAVPAVPIQMPIAALWAVGLPIPTILLVLGYLSNPLLDRQYPSPEAAVADCLLFIEWLERNVCWLAECFRRIILQRAMGFDTVWDFGTVLGMGKDEFFDLVADSRAEAGLNELDILLSTIEDAPLSYNELDFDVAEIIRPWYTHLGMVGDSTQVGVGLYPIESDLASPMDTLMSTGFNDMTFEISDMQAKETGKDDIPTLQAWI